MKSTRFVSVDAPGESNENNLSQFKMATLTVSLFRMVGKVNFKSSLCAESHIFTHVLEKVLCTNRKVKTIPAGGFILVSTCKNL